MATHQIGRIVTVSLVGGLVAAPARVVGPVAGAQEHVITGTVLLTFAASWALLAMLATLWTAQPQRWAAATQVSWRLRALLFWPSSRVGSVSMRSGGCGRRSSSRFSLEQ